MTEALVHVDGNAEPMVVRFDGPDPTFDLATDLIRATCKSELDTLNVDLLEIAATVFAADSAVKRGGPTRQKMGEAWRRSFDFVIPVRNPAFWNRTEVRQALVDAVGFLTEDHLSFSFTQRAVTVERQPFLDFDPAGASFEAEEVILFSGGLDSFAGALEALSTSRKKVILLTHRSAQKAIPRQVNLGEYLAKRFNGRVLHIHVLGRRIGMEASNSSQRSRSFLFAALGQLVARSFGARHLSFYENGVISHNLPISSQVVGTMATRTTHPLSLHRLNALMQLLGPDHVPIENRYCWLTKRDVVERIAQHGGQQEIPLSVSCTSIREQTKQHTHCGTCSQCLDRRFALLAAGLAEHDFASDYGTDILFGPREKPPSRTMAVEWTRHALSLPHMNPLTFMAKFGSEFSRIAEGHPEQSKQAVLDLCVAMHARHGESVKQVLDQVWRDKSQAILQGELPSTSLVAMLLRQQGFDVGTPLKQAPSAPPPVRKIGPEDETDLIPDPESPLRVAFSEENGHPIVSIQGLCVLTGPQARVPTDLKAKFLEDLHNGIQPDDHCFVAVGTLAAKQNTTKLAIRRQVSRCRQTLGESFRLVHGREMDKCRFIQTRSPRGYRLAPSIMPISEDDA